MEPVVCTTLGTTCGSCQAGLEILVDLPMWSLVGQQDWKKMDWGVNMLLALCWCRVSNWVLFAGGARNLWSKQPLPPVLRMMSSWVGNRGKLPPCDLLLCQPNNQLPYLEYGGFLFQLNLAAWLANVCKDEQVGKYSRYLNRVQNCWRLITFYGRTYVYCVGKVSQRRKGVVGLTQILPPSNEDLLLLRLLQPYRFYGPISKVLLPRDSMHRKYARSTHILCHSKKAVFESRILTISRSFGCSYLILALTLVPFSSETDFLNIF